MGERNARDLGQSLHAAFCAQRLSRPSSRDGAHQCQRQQTESGSAMKLATFEVDGRERIGAVLDGGIVELTGDGLPTGMIELITRWPTLKEKIARLVGDSKPRYQLGDVHIL